MLTRWKVAVITGLFAFGALNFILGLFPLLADIFWILWFTGCGACILALVLTVIVPSQSPAAKSSVAGHPATPSPTAHPAPGPVDGVSQP
ncbi:hypothetical protein [Brevibacterium zhoupengii]|uniref:hypothetical protein n=1 Tax=Brevibacterium zhoupengii TaxID=2898795 RepID=UPI001E52A1F9|nr:hypothetical protein [Brevibacterium zhoupengii]